MIPHSFDYHAPETVDGVFDLIDKYGEASKLMAGGQSLLPMMKFRLVSPGHIIDLSRLRGLDGISETGSEIRIGALATHRNIEESRVLQKSCPLLAKAAACLGDVRREHRDRRRLGRPRRPGCKLLPSSGRSSCEVHTSLERRRTDCCGGGFL